MIRVALVWRGSVGRERAGCGGGGSREELLDVDVVGELGEEVSGWGWDGDVAMVCWIAVGGRARVREEEEMVIWVLVSLLLRRD
jgi:hypothetical protein